MNNQNLQQTPLDFFKALQTIRFTFVIIILGLSYFSIRFSFCIDNYKEVWDGMGLKLAPITYFILMARPLLMASSFLFPLAAVILCWYRNILRSFQIICILTLLTIVQLIFLYEGLLAPLSRLVSNMSGSN
jgi:hypothetical protein